MIDGLGRWRARPRPPPEPDTMIRSQTSPPVMTCPAGRSVGPGVAPEHTPEPGEQLALTRPHLRLLARRGVVPPAQVQPAVDDQQRELVLGRPRRDREPEPLRPRAQITTSPTSQGSASSTGPAPSMGKERTSVAVPSPPRCSTLRAAMSAESTRVSDTSARAGIPSAARVSASSRDRISEIDGERRSRFGWGAVVAGHDRRRARLPAMVLRVGGRPRSSSSTST